MQLRFFPLVLVLGIACSDETAPAPNAAGALGGVQSPAAETPRAAEVSPAAETRPVAKPVPTESKTTSNISTKYDKTADALVNNIKG